MFPGSSYLSSVHVFNRQFSEVSVAALNVICKTNGPKENLVFFFFFFEAEGLGELNKWEALSYWLGFSRKTTQRWQYRAGTNGSEKSTEHGVCYKKRWYGGVLLLL